MKRRKTTLPRLAVYAMSKAELVRLLNAAEAFPTLVRALEETIQALRTNARVPRRKPTSSNDSRTPSPNGDGNPESK